MEASSRVFALAVFVVALIAMPSCIGQDGDNDTDSVDSDAARDSDTDDRP